MIIKPNKTVEEHTVEFEKDYQTIINNGSHNLTSPLMTTAPTFQIYTVYTDNTPVTASNSSVIVKL